MFKMAASKKGGWLSVRYCPSFGMRPQIEFSPAKVRKHKNELLALLQTQTVPVAIFDDAGEIIHKSPGWPQ